MGLDCEKGRVGLRGAEPDPTRPRTRTRTRNLRRDLLLQAYKVLRVRPPDRARRVPENGIWYSPCLTQ
jgi:hypothetical protein